jgi:hypothetical protein
MAQAGEIDQKPVLTLITTYPGISPVDSEGEDIKNKKDFKNFGYAFIKPKMNEKRMNHLMLWENFIGDQRGVNEGIFSSSPLFEDEIKVAKNKILKLNGEFGIRAQVSSELQTSNSKITGFMCSISEVPILLHDLEFLSPEGMANRFEDIIRRSMGEKQKYFTQLLEINPGGLFSRFSKISFGTDLRGESYMYFPYKENRESPSGYVIPRIRRQDNTKGVGVKKVSVFFDFSHYDRIYNVKKELLDVGSLQDFWNMNPQGQSFNGGEDLFRGKTTYHLFFRKIED